MSNKVKSFISIVTYIHNNEKQIPAFFDTVYNTFDQLFEKFEFVFVDDASTDNSSETISSVSKSFEADNIRIIHMSYEQGVEKSMNAGVDLSIGDYIYEFDNCIIDFQDFLIFNMYQKIIEGNDIVCAVSRKTKLSSSLFYRVFNHSSNTDFSISNERVRIISRRAVNRIHMISKTVPYRKAVYANCGLKKAQIEYDPINSYSKRNSLSRGERVNMAVNTLILFTNIAYKLAITLSLLMVFSTVCVAIYAVIVYISQNPVPGFTPLLLVITLSFSATFAILSIVIKYLSIITELVFLDANYVISDIEKVN